MKVVFFDRLKKIILWLLLMSLLCRHHVSAAFEAANDVDVAVVSDTADVAVVADDVDIVTVAIAFDGVVFYLISIFLNLKRAGVGRPGVTLALHFAEVVALVASATLTTQVQLPCCCGTCSPRS
jgi:hypothetical protein